MKIVLDPGHDPKFIGARAIFDEVTKVRQIVSCAEKQLVKCGFDVIVVPDGLGGNTANENLIEKIEWINKNSEKKDLLISVHCNAGGGEGTEVLFYGGDNYSRGIAQSYCDILAEVTNSINRGVKPDTMTRFGRLGIIKDTVNIPALLSENGFVDSHADAGKPPETYAEALHRFVHSFTGTTCNEVIQIKDNYEQKYYALKEGLKNLLTNY